MEKKLAEDRFRHDLKSFTHLVRSRFGFEDKKSISISEGESLDIDPRFKYGVVLRLVQHDDRAGYERKLSIVVRRTADVDFIDEDLRYIPLENVDRFEASSRIIQAQEALFSISNL
jgi:hypothetical protein